MPKADPYEYIRTTYGVPVKVGQRIKVNGRMGTVRKPKPTHLHYVRVQFDGDQHRELEHPTWETVYYAEDEITVLADHQKQTKGA